MTAAMAWLRGRGRSVELGLILAASFDGALSGTLPGAPAFAAGGGGGSPGEAEASPGGSSGCPSSNPPNQIPRRRHRDPHHRRVRIYHPRTVKVKTNACGIAVAPAFTANDTQGGYVVPA